MPKSPEQFKPEENDKERINDPELAEGMAYAGKPYRDTSYERAQENEAELNYYRSDEFRKERIAEINEEFQESLKYIEGLSEPERSKYLKEIHYPLYGEGSEISKEIAKEMLDEWVNYPIEFRTTNEQNEGRKKWIEGPISTAIQKEEDYRRTYLRRAKQKLLSKPEALKEASQVKERATEEAEARLQYGELLKDFQGEIRHLGWEELKQYNAVRNWLNKPLDKHIRREDYEEALEYIERLKEIPPSSFISWLRAQVELKALELKDRIRKQKEKSE